MTALLLSFGDGLELEPQGLLQGAVLMDSPAAALLNPHHVHAEATLPTGGSQPLVNCGGTIKTGTFL